MDIKIIHDIEAAGFTVYMRKLSDTYCYFTDGTNIGYLQQSRGGGGGVDISTVNLPSRKYGTGFRVENEYTGPLDRGALERAFVTLERAFVTPDWVRRAPAVVKWPSVEAFLKASSWGGGLHATNALNVTKEG